MIIWINSLLALSNEGDAMELADFLCTYSTVYTDSPDITLWVM